MPLPYPEGTTALATDSEQRSLTKIVELISTGSGGGGGGLTIVSSAPVADPGSGPHTAYDPATGEYWVWNGSAWDLLFGGGA